MLRNRKVKIGRFSVSLLTVVAIVLMASIGTVFAVAYVVLQWTATATVSANPKVCFIKWQDGSKQNTFDYAVSIFPSIKTIDENITYGIWNWDTASHTVYLRWSGLTNSGNIARLYIKVHDGANTIYSKEWTSIPTFPTVWESFNVPANTKYSIWLEITATSGATGSSVFTFELKVENP
jgi:hypothetical protein